VSIIYIQVYISCRNINPYIVLLHTSFSEQAKLAKELEEKIKETMALLLKVGKYL
jgi:hypothetical protein